jgi:hypothetical protein
MATNRIVIAGVGVVVVLGIGFVSAFLTAWTWWGTCGGDGGYGYSAPNSVAGRFCDSQASTPYFLAQVALPVLIATALSITAGVQRRLGRVWLGLSLAVAVLLTMSVVVEWLPDTCNAGQATSDPEGCDTY